MPTILQGFTPAMGQTKRRTARTLIVVRTITGCRDGSAGVARTFTATSWHVPRGAGWASNGTCASSRFRFRRGLVGGRARSTRPVWPCNQKRTATQSATAVWRRRVPVPPNQTPNVSSILTVLDDFGPIEQSNIDTHQRCPSGQYFAEHVQAEAGRFSPFVLGSPWYL